MQSTLSPAYPLASALPVKRLACRLYSLLWACPLVWSLPWPWFGRCLGLFLRFGLRLGRIWTFIEKVIIIKLSTCAFVDIFRTLVISWCFFFAFIIVASVSFAFTFAFSFAFWAFWCRYVSIWWEEKSTDDVWARYVERRYGFLFANWGKGLSIHTNKRDFWLYSHKILLKWSTIF